MTSSKDQAQNSKELSSSNGSKKYDLEDRTLRFAVNAIEFCKKLPGDRVNDRLVSQLVRSATSIGANYREAVESVSKKEFSNKAGICRKEAKETSYWLQVVAKANPSHAETAAALIDESNQFVKIFATIVRNSLARR